MRQLILTFFTAWTSVFRNLPINWSALYFRHVKTATDIFILKRAQLGINGHAHAMLLFKVIHEKRNRFYQRNF